MLGDGKGLSGESGLVHPQLAHGGKAQVSRNTVSRIEENDVSRNELIGGDTTPFPITTLVRLVQESNAPSSILVTPFGTM